MKLQTFFGPGFDFFEASFNNLPNSSDWPSYDQSSQVSKWPNPPPISWQHLFLIQPHSSLPKGESEHRHAVPLNTQGGPRLYLLASKELSPGQCDKIAFWFLVLQSGRGNAVPPRELFGLAVGAVWVVIKANIYPASFPNRTCYLESAQVVTKSESCLLSQPRTQAGIKCQYIIAAGLACWIMWQGLVGISSLIHFSL